MKHRFVLLSSLSLLGLILSDCKKALTTEELETYLADPAHGLTQKREVADLSIEVAYRPSSLVASANDSLPSSSSTTYYLLSISRGEREVLDPARGFSAYSSLLQTLAFRSQEFIRLTTARGDTLLPSNSILERTYGMGASTRILVAFPAKSRDQDAVFHLAEFGLHTGNLLFTFKKADVARIPFLKQAPTKEP